MAAVLACGPGAVLSHRSAAALWGIRGPGERGIEVSIPERRTIRRPGLVVHRRRRLAATDVAGRDGIPVTSPICTLIDLAPRLTPRQLEAAVNEADKLGLVGPDELRRALGAESRPGVPALRRLLDPGGFVRTDSDLERRFLPLARSAGLPLPRTRAMVNGYRVDFYWPELKLVVETDGLRYHRTTTQQARDLERDQAHVASGLTCLRFTFAQVAFEPRYVVDTLIAVARRLGEGGPPNG
ncbi:MAG TPA: DUF559 domain-containing protein [Thermoleophilaceae bacterium]|jgi:very-short-patch-repair endonuclease